MWLAAAALASVLPLAADQGVLGRHDHGPTIHCVEPRLLIGSQRVTARQIRWQALVTAEALRDAAIKPDTAITDVHARGEIAPSGLGACEVTAAPTSAQSLEELAASAASPADPSGAAAAVHSRAQELRGAHLGTVFALGGALRWDGASALVLQLACTRTDEARRGGPEALADSNTPLVSPLEHLALCGRDTASPLRPRAGARIASRRGSGATPPLAGAIDTVATDARGAAAESDGEAGTGGADGADDDDDDDDDDPTRDFIAVLSPSQPPMSRTAQALLTPGHHYEVRWVSRGELGALRVELRKHHASGASSYWLLSEGVLDVGVWDWYIAPGAFAEGSNYQLRLASTLKPSVVGDSALFAIKSGQLIYVSWVLLMVAMLGTMCCTVSVCRAVQQARDELRRAELARRGAGTRTGAGLPASGEASDDDEGDGEDGDDEEDAPPPREPEWRPGTPPEQQLEEVTISRFQCCICMENAIDTVIVPCGHSVACLPCMSGCATCPICRADIERVVRVFHK